MFLMAPMFLWNIERVWLGFCMWLLNLRFPAGFGDVGSDPRTDSALVVVLATLERLL